MTPLYFELVTGTMYQFVAGVAGVSALCYGVMAMSSKILSEDTRNEINAKCQASYKTECEKSGVTYAPPGKLFPSFSQTVRYKLSGLVHTNGNSGLVETWHTSSPEGIVTSSALVRADGKILSTIDRSLIKVSKEEFDASWGVVDSLVNEGGYLKSLARTSGYYYPGENQYPVAIKFC